MFNIKRGKEEDIIEEEKKIAEKLKELTAASDGAGIRQPEYSQLSPVEQLSTDIAAHLANVTAKRLYGIINDIQEVKAPEGYLVNDEILEVTITEDGTDNIHVKTYNESIKGNDTIQRGGVKVAKIDNDLDTNYAQGDATLAGAEFTIYNQSKETVMVGGKEIEKGGAALVITTNADGIATSDSHALPYGSYLVKETKPSEGYLLNTEWSRAFTIREDGKIVDLTEDKVREAVIRGGVQIIKRDKELVKSEALGGARLDDIVMTIKIVSG